MKIAEREEARRIRQEEGESIKMIAKRLGVSKGTVSLWVRDIYLTAEQKKALDERHKGHKAKRKGSSVVEAKSRELRQEAQHRGRERVFKEDETYRLCCALYWAEGDKDKCSVAMSNTDPAMLRWLIYFLKEYFDCSDDRFSVRVMAHVNNGLTPDEINSYWLSEVGLPYSCLRKFTDKGKYYNPNNSKKKRHEYGCCKVAVCDVEISQQIFGSIQELFGIEREEWLS